MITPLGGLEVGDIGDMGMRIGIEDVGSCLYTDVGSCLYTAGFGLEEDCRRRGVCLMTGLARGLMLAGRPGEL